MRRWWHRHRPTAGIYFVDLCGHGSYRSSACSCGMPLEQRLTYFGKPIGPWRDASRVPCTHGVGGVSVPACMNCAVEREKRGLAS